jgi:uncharacterized protein with PQ loop repeat
MFLEIVLDYSVRFLYILKMETKGNQMTNTKKVAEVGGWVGMVLIHGATLPVTIAVILGMSTHLPPLSMVVMIWFGLALFFFRALARFDWLYLFSNGVGFCFQSVLLYLIISTGG